MNQKKCLLRFQIPLLLMLVLLLIKPWKITMELNSKYFETNDFCLADKISKLDKSICTYNRFDKMVIIYVDSMPYYLAKILEKHYPTEMQTFSINNPGIIDSGPIFFNYLTGRINYQYRSKGVQVDNVFSQFQKNKDVVLNAAAPPFMVNDLLPWDNAFDSIQLTENGIDKINPRYEVFNLRQVRNITNSTDLKILSKNRNEIINGTKSMITFWQKYTKEQYKGKTQKQSFDNHFKNQSWFVYVGDTDVVAHEYSASRIETQFSYAQQIANVKSFYDDYLNVHAKDTLLVFMSDHGTYDFPYQNEITNHGYQDKENRAFAFFLNKKFNNENLWKNEEIHISQFAGTLCMYLKNCNIPIFSTHSPVPKYKNNTAEQLIAFRSREIQLTKYLMKETFNVQDINLDSPFEKFKDLDFGVDLLVKHNRTEVEEVLERYPEFIVEQEKRTWYKDLTRQYLGYFLVTLAIIIALLFYLAYDHRFLCKKKLRLEIPRIAGSKRSMSNNLDFSPEKYIYHKAVICQYIVFFCFVIILQWLFPFDDKHLRLAFTLNNLCMILMLLPMFISIPRKLGQNLTHLKLVQIPALCFFIANFMFYMVFKFLHKHEGYFQDWKNKFQNYFCILIGTGIILSYYVESLRMAKTRPVLLSCLTKVILVCIVQAFCYQSFLLMCYEFELNYCITDKNEVLISEVSRKNLIFYADHYIVTIIIIVGQSYFVNFKSASQIFFCNILSLMLWFHNAYFRIITFVVIVPILEQVNFQLKEQNENIIQTNLRNSNTQTEKNGAKQYKQFLSNVLYMLAITAYFIFYGGTYTNINGRASRRVHETLFEYFGISDSVVWCLTKYSLIILIVSYQKFRMTQEFYSLHFVYGRLHVMINKFYVQNYFYMNLIVLGVCILIFEFLHCTKIEAELRAYIMMVPFFCICVGINYLHLIFHTTKWILLRFLACIRQLEDPNDCIATIDDEINLSPTRKKNQFDPPVNVDHLDGTCRSEKEFDSIKYIDETRPEFKLDIGDELKIEVAEDSRIN